MEMKYNLETNSNQIFDKTVTQISNPLQKKILAEMRTK